MKKLDLHIHTIKTISDHDFTFSMDTLKKYIKTLHIDGVAITNHNIFDLEQFYKISKELEDVCTVLPGIEINLGNKGFGHMLCITDPDDLEDFSSRCGDISDKINDVSDKVTYEELTHIFIDMGKYLWIPHYDKNPCVDDKIINVMSKYILCGETGSVKKFIYRQKDKNSLIPVYFSDLRPTKDLKEFPTRQTYFDIDDISIGSIKRTLLNRWHVSLTEDEGKRLFYVLPNLPISTGLSVIMGERSSGKTHTLDEIASKNKNIKYIKQFALIETNPDKEAKDFTDKIAVKRSSYAEEYLEPFRYAVDIVKDISLENDDHLMEEYISALVKYAKETDRADMFAKCALYNESPFPTRNLENLSGLIDAVEKLLNAREYKDIIEQHVKRVSLISLYKALVHQYNIENRKLLEEAFVNDIVNKIRKLLRRNTSVTTVPDIDFYRYQMNRVKVKKFNDLVTRIKHKETIQSQNVGGFFIQTTKRPFQSAQELKTFCGRRSVSFTPIFPLYQNNSFQYLQKLKEIAEIPESDYYKYFVYLDYKILNMYGFPVSGGERAEFNLLQEINDAHRYDMLLIDEPESSFDNIFLKEKVNHIIKELAQNMPVILVTHNNTVGASIKPDYIIFTERKINDEISYKRYYGLPSSKYLTSFEGEKIKNIKVMLDCLEAGEETYNERKHDYDLLKN